MLLTPEEIKVVKDFLAPAVKNGLLDGRRLNELLKTGGFRWRKPTGSAGEIIYCKGGCRTTRLPSKINLPLHSGRLAECHQNLRTQHSYSENSIRVVHFREIIRKQR